tara:strand:- start:1405 stop:1887 length:483 start_codon:yes stop_codon:yes gene_type:complete
MSIFESAWNILKNAPVPNYAQPSTMFDRSGMEDERERELHREKYLQGREDKPYGLAERMPRPDMGHGESSFDSERMNTGTSVFNPTPSWQNVGQGPVGEMYANRLNNMAGEMGTTQTPQTPPTPTTAMGATGGQVGVQQTPPPRQPNYPSSVPGLYPSQK